MTEYVAFVHDGRVLVDEAGTLPSFVPDKDEDALALALGLVDADVLLAPVTQLTDERRVHVVGTRGAARSGSFVPPAALADAELAEVVVRAVTELDPERTPVLRPDWFRPGWFDRVEAWVDEVLVASGRQRTAPVEVVKAWSISVVARVSTDGGILWFKAPCDHFRAEAAIHSTLFGLFPELVPTLVAVDEQRAWLLMEPMSGADDGDRAEGAGREVAVRWAKAQMEAIVHTEALLAGGCAFRGEAGTMADFRRVLTTSTDLALLTPDELAAVRASLDEIEGLVAQFWSAGIPNTLAHGDLHLGNVAWDGRSLRIFDWTDGCVSHPFLDASHLARFSQSRPADPELEAIYAQQWRAAYPDADIDRALALAPLVDLVFQAVTFDNIVNATEPQSRWELGGVVADLLRVLPGRVAGLR